MRIKRNFQQYVDFELECNHLLPPKSCLSIYPPTQVPSTHEILRTTISQFVVISDGTKRIFTNQDRSLEYSTSGIIAPAHVSYMNLFVNAMLQPSPLYHVKEGLLTLTSADLPPKGVPIILQFVIIHRN